MALALRVWPLVADWADGVPESLEWYTELLTGISGAVQSRELRLAPRRSWRPKFKAAEAERRIADGFLARVGAAKFAMPIWPEGQVLSAAVTVGQTTVPCSTAGRGFVDMVIFWRSPSECAAYACTPTETGLSLSSAMDRAWPKGTRIWPGAQAQFFEPPRWAEWSDESGSLEGTFTESAPVDWVGVAPAATYRGLPVLEWRPNTNADPESAHERSLALEDGGTGPIVAFDFPSMPFRNVQHSWLVSGREEHTALRDLLYYLRGRAAVLWVPTWNRDLVPTTTVASGATQIIIERCGFATDFGPHRRDLRIEHVDGRIAYVRATAVTASTSTETVTLASALPWGFTPAQCRSIGFLVVSRPVRDAVQVNHMTDAEGLATVALQFRAERVPGSVSDGV